MKEIYLAGGCFWGMQAYFDNIQGVIATCVGYANGVIEHPTYDLVCQGDSGFAETIQVHYDESIVSLSFLLLMYFDVIEPTSYHKQGGDIGSQYRTGVYYVNEEDSSIILNALAQLQTQFKEPVVVECELLQNFYLAETYHQEYLKKNPNGYCHISHQKIKSAKDVKEVRFLKPSKEALRASLTPLQYAITQESQTEPPFQNSFWNHYEKGIYVDITTGEPLFLSNKKFESNCGWPSFSAPINTHVVKQLRDKSHGMERIEVRSSIGDAHLGHVFQDGPKELGGMRYCMNSASLRFIPYANMQAEGYQEYIPLLD